MSEQVSHPHNTTGKITIFYTLTIMCLYSTWRDGVTPKWKHAFPECLSFPHRGNFELSANNQLPELYQITK